MGGDGRQGASSSEERGRCVPLLLDSIPESRLSTEGPVRKRSRRSGRRTDPPSTPHSLAMSGYPPDQEVSTRIGGSGATHREAYHDNVGFSIT